MDKKQPREWTRELNEWKLKSTARYVPSYTYDNVQ